MKHMAFFCWISLLMGIHCCATKVPPKVIKYGELGKQVNKASVQTISIQKPVRKSDRIKALRKRRQSTKLNKK